MTTPRPYVVISIGVTVITAVVIALLQYMSLVLAGAIIDTATRWALVIAPAPAVLTAGALLLLKRPPQTGWRCLVNSLVGGERRGAVRVNVRTTDLLRGKHSQTVRIVSRNGLLVARTSSGRIFPFRVWR